MANQNRKNNKLQPNKPSKPSALVASTQYESISGPLPSAQQFEQYEAVLPGAADRIVSMAEAQAAHRQALEVIAVKQGSRDSFLGVIFGFAICVVAIVSGAYVIVNGHDWPGTILGGSGIAGLAGVFVYGTRSGRKERERKG